MELKDRQLAFGNANNVAATIYAAVHIDGEPFDLGTFEAIRDVVFESSIEKQEQFAANVVTDAFPGAQVVPLQQPAAAPAPVAQAAPQPAPVGPAPAAGPGPAPIPGASQSTGVEDLWKDLFADASKWYDNRGDAEASLNGGNRPDFRRKSDKKGLWINGKAPTPAWVKQQLGVA